MVALAVALMSLLVSLLALAHVTFKVRSPMLGRQCVVTVGGRSYLATCVAVTWRGAIAVSGQTKRTRELLWIEPRDIAERVSWCD